jgi:succinyl-CoA synthetase beta subunit
MNIFGGITRCDEVAEGIRLAKEEFGIDKLIVVRFEGTNKDKGLEILSSIPNVVYADGLIQGVDALVERREQL